jgi:cysteine desulfurase
MKVDYSSKTYLDYAATTPVDSRVLEAMLPYLTNDYGNPSSIHMYGQRAETAIENARTTMANVINCEPEEIIFTSCGTESDNLALRGAAHKARQNQNKKHILISPVEHPAVNNTAHQLANYFDFQVEYLPVNEFGQVTPRDVKERITSDTAVVSVIFANNEIGSINPIAEIGQICLEKGTIFHTDAVQAAAHLAIDIKELNTDLIAFGAHKLYGPKGIGALYVRKGVSLQSVQTGGGQELNLRAGTSNVPYIVGQAEAFRLAAEERENRLKQMTIMRNQIIGVVLETIPDTKLTGHPSNRLPNHTSFVIHGIDGNELIMHLDIEGFACSSGSACKTGNPEPSKVLKAIGIEDDWALGSLRVTVGQYTTDQDIERFSETLPKTVSKLRSLNKN